MSNKGYFALVCYISWILWIYNKTLYKYIAKGFITKSYILDMSGDIGYNRYMSEDDVKPWDLLNPNSPRSQEELVAYRLEICSTCPFYRKLSNTCRKCGCFMKLKSSLANAKCPVGKW